MRIPDDAFVCYDTLPSTHHFRFTRFPWCAAMLCWASALAPIAYLTYIRSPPQATNKQHVLIVGAGVAGLQAARALDKQGIAFTILERNDDVGGVWRDNYQDYALQGVGDCFVVVMDNTHIYIPTASFSALACV